MRRMASAPAARASMSLKWVEDEVLAQTGNFDDAGGLVQVGERTLEELLVGEDGESGGAGGLKGAGQRRGVKVAADQTF